MRLASFCSAPAQFQTVSISILREYLLNEFAVCQKVKFAFDFERVIDDIVFMCFFVGNDFLPHLPSLDIRDGALDFLFNVYKRILPSFGGFITSDGGRVNLLLVDRILEEVAPRHSNAAQRGDGKRGDGVSQPELQAGERAKRASHN